SALTRERDAGVTDAKTHPVGGRCRSVPTTPVSERSERGCHYFPPVTLRRTAEIPQVQGGPNRADRDWRDRARACRPCRDAIRSDRARTTRAHYGEPEGRRRLEARARPHRETCASQWCGCAHGGRLDDRRRADDGSAERSGNRRRRTRLPRRDGKRANALLCP